MSSAILSADDLNDFISPGVACIKPVETLPRQDDSSNPYEVTTEDKVQAQNPTPASISLTDCLACSGCVTSAEAVLVSLQSHNEVLNTLDAHPALDIAARLSNFSESHSPPDAKVFVASVSPQVRASIAATLGISERRAGNLVEQFLSGSQGLRLGGKHNSSFAYVFDTNRLREACLVLSADEMAASIAEKSRPKPVITSACPGWICYAEKTHPHVLPHLSALKSPQAMTGTLLKSVLSKQLGIHPSQIWHLAIMPCFDKKLEASREELTDKWWRETEAGPEATAVRDVDCVITSRELFSLADTRSIQLARISQQALTHAERIPFPDARIGQFLRPETSRYSEQPTEAGTSGGFLYYILKSQQQQYPGSQIVASRGRNADVLDFALTTSTGRPIMKCARYYGFRNIQNLVRKLKPPKQSRLPGAARRAALASGSGADYAYVEVMACPGGCTNGGGQLKLEDVAEILPQTRGEKVENAKSPQSQKEWLARVDKAYYSAESDDETSPVDSDHDTSTTDTDSTDGEKGNEMMNGIAAKEVRDLLHHWADLVGVGLDKLAYTTYRKVESDVGKNKNMGDSERIAAVAGMSGGGW